jgi:hypothetical protein
VWKVEKDNTMEGVMVGKGAAKILEWLSAQRAYQGCPFQKVIHIQQFSLSVNLSSEIETRLSIPQLMAKAVHELRATSSRGEAHRKCPPSKDISLASTC